MNVLRTEPAMISGLVVAIVAALAIPDAWAKVVFALLPLVLAVFTRSQVTPVAKIPVGDAPAP